MQDKTLGDLLVRLGETNKTNEDFQKAFNSLKDDSQFKQDIGAINTLDSKGWELLKKWCSIKYVLPLNEDSIEQQLPLVQKYCTKQETNKVTSNAGGLGWMALRKEIKSRGISEKGQLFVVVTDLTNRDLGKTKTETYCWDKESDSWKSSLGAEDCRKKDGSI